MSDDIRSAIEEAMNTSSEETGGSNAGQASAAAPESVAAPAESTVQERATPSTSAEQRTATSGNVALAGGPQAVPATPEVLKAPVSWKPEVREAWNNLPPPVQQEVLRREREIMQGLQTASEARRFHQEFQQIISPYQAILAAENAHPLQAVQNLLQTAAALRTAPPAQRAQLVAQVVRQFGIDINMLDQALAGTMQPQQAADPTVQYVNQQLAPVMQFVNEMRGRQQQFQQQTQQQMEQTVEQFISDPQNEFINDVKEQMATLLDNAAAVGRKMGLQEAYDYATMLHPTISQIVAQRKLAQQAGNSQAAAQRAQQAAVSVAGSGAPSQQEIPVGDDIRSAVIASMSELQNRVR